MSGCQCQRLCQSAIKPCVQRFGSLEPLKGGCQTQRQLALWLGAITDGSSCCRILYISGPIRCRRFSGAPACKYELSGASTDRSTQQDLIGS